jgi:hypothetical protein
VPVAGAATVVWLLAHTSRSEAIGVAITMGVAAAYYLIRRQALSRRMTAGTPALDEDEV